MAKKKNEPQAEPVAPPVEEAEPKAQAEPPEQPLEIPQVPLGVGTIQDHEERLCILERKAGLR